MKKVRHVLITAGSKGLGKMMTDYFLKKGCSVTATYRSDKSRADQLVEMYKDKQDRLQVLQLDVTDQEQIDKVVEQAVAASAELLLCQQCRTIYF